MTGDQLYLRQLLAGRDFALGDPAAAQMVNYVYLIGDRSSGEAVVVDPAWAVGDLLGLLDADGMTPVGVIATHYHADHVGGNLFGHRIQGLAELAGLADLPVHANEHEVPWIARTTGLAAGDVVGHAGGDTLAVGAIELSLLHTPGHTPGSQCVLVDGHLVSGDTLFLDGCGRTDLPGSDPGAMWDSLQRLAGLPAGTTVHPGHDYSPPRREEEMGRLRETNYVFRPPSREAWLQAFGG